MKRTTRISTTVIFSVNNKDLIKDISIPTSIDATFGELPKDFPASSRGHRPSTQFVKYGETAKKKKQQSFVNIFEPFTLSHFAPRLIIHTNEVRKRLTRALAAFQLFGFISHQ